MFHFIRTCLSNSKFTWACWFGVCQLRQRHCIVWILKQIEIVKNNTIRLILAYFIKNKCVPHNIMYVFTLQAVHVSINSCRNENIAIYFFIYKIKLKNVGSTDHLSSFSGDGFMQISSRNLKTMGFIQKGRYILICTFVRHWLNGANCNCILCWHGNMA